MKTLKKLELRKIEESLNSSTINELSLNDLNHIRGGVGFTITLDTVTVTPNGSYNDYDDDVEDNDN